MGQSINLKNNNEIFLDDSGRLYLITRTAQGRNNPFKESVRRINQIQLFNEKGLRI